MMLRTYKTASFEAQIGGTFAALNLLEDDINSLTEDFKEAIHETAAKVLAKLRKKKKPWVIDDTPDLCDKRREPKKENNKTRKLRQ